MAEQNFCLNFYKMDSKVNARMPRIIHNKCVKLVYLLQLKLVLSPSLWWSRASVSTYASLSFILIAFNFKVSDAPVKPSGTKTKTQKQVFFYQSSPLNLYHLNRFNNDIIIFDMGSGIVYLMFNLFSFLLIVSTDNKKVNCWKTSTSKGLVSCSANNGNVM